MLFIAEAVKERGGPGMFPHVCDVEGRKVVERT